jgi:hypothetical protein
MTSDHLATLAEHYAAMARNPGSIDYARNRVRELVAAEPGMYGELPAMVGQILAPAPAHFAEVP